MSELRTLAVRSALKCCRVTYPPPVPAEYKNRKSESEMMFSQHSGKKRGSEAAKYSGESIFDNREMSLVRGAESCFVVFRFFGRFVLNPLGVESTVK